MSMQEKPVVSVLPDGGKYWTHDFEQFSALVYVPAGDPRAEVINYGFRAPYLLVFGEPDRSIGDAVDFAERRGLADIARSCSSSVVFVVPRCEGGWQAAFRRSPRKARSASIMKTAISSTTNSGQRISSVPPSAVPFSGLSCTDSVHQRIISPGTV